MSTTNKISNDEFICRGLPNKCSPPSGGCGKAFYDLMTIHKYRIQQIDPITDRKQTYGEIKKLSVRVAIELKSRGIHAGDIVCLCLLNTMETILPVFGTMFIGGVIFPLHPNLDQDDFNHLLGLTRPKIIFTVPVSRDKIVESLKKLRLNSPIIVMDPKKNLQDSLGVFVEKKNDERQFEPTVVDNSADLFIMCSSGTSGPPKGVRVTHGAVSMIGTILSRCEYNIGITLMYSPLYWISAILNITMTMFGGNTRIITGSFSVESFLDIVEKYKVTFSLLTPECVIHTSKHPSIKTRDLSSLKQIAIGGSTTTEEQLNDCREVFGESTVILNAYGLTEMSGFSSIFMRDMDVKAINSKKNSVGKLLPGYQLKIVDVRTRVSLPRNRNGEILLKTYMLSPGYYNNPNAWNDCIDPDGFFKTGDIGYVDDDDCLFIVDRIKFIIKYKGFQISPSDIEDVLIKHPDVVKACVLGKSQGKEGELPAAFVVKKNDSNLTEQQLIEFVNARVSDVKRLRGGVRFIDSIPMTPSGKVKRGYLKKLLEQET